MYGIKMTEGTLFYTFKYMHKLIYICWEIFFVLCIQMLVSMSRYLGEVWMIALSTIAGLYIM